MTERQVQDKFMRAFKKTGFYHAKIISASTAGHPDCIACIKGYFYAFEFKSTNGNLTELQKYRRKQIFVNNGKYVLVCPENVDYVISKILRAAFYKNINI